VFLCQLDTLPKDLAAATSSRELAKGEVLCRQGEPVKAVFVVVTGRVQLCAVTSDGKHLPLYTARSGECVAEAALFAESYCSDVVAEVRSVVRIFPVKSLQATLRERPDLAAEFMSLQSKRCQILRMSLELRSLRTARERILQYVEMFAPSGSRTVTLDRTLKNVADDLGLTHESFYRTLRHLIEEGILTRTKTTIAIQL